MRFSQLFIGQDGLLRSGWRFAIFISAFTVAGLAFGAVAVLISRAAGFDLAGGGAAFLAVNALFSLIPAILLGWWCGRVLDRVPFHALGVAPIRGWLWRFLMGLGFGGLTLSVAVLISVVFGGLSFTATQTDFVAVARTMVLSFLVFAVAAAFEEVLFRGYAMQTFFRSGLGWFGILLTSFLFALVHQGNPRADLLSWANTFIAGIWFGFAYWKTRDLWMPFGMHLMWNWMQGAFFGIEVSGLTDITSAPLLREIDRGPAWLTGLDYGVEAGIACTAALAISILSIALLPAAPVRTGGST